jgi:hypothetical protein
MHRRAPEHPQRLLAPRAVGPGATGSASTANTGRAAGATSTASPSSTRPSTSCSSPVIVTLIGSVSRRDRLAPVLRRRRRSAEQQRRRCGCLAGLGPGPEERRRPGRSAAAVRQRQHEVLRHQLSGSIGRENNRCTTARTGNT